MDSKFKLSIRVVLSSQGFYPHLLLLDVVFLDIFLFLLLLLSLLLLALPWLLDVRWSLDSILVGEMGFLAWIGLLWVSHPLVPFLSLCYWSLLILLTCTSICYWCPWLEPCHLIFRSLYFVLFLCCPPSFSAFYPLSSMLDRSCSWEVRNSKALNLLCLLFIPLNLIYGLGHTTR